MVWSSDERYFFYLAEKKPAKTRSYFDQKPDDGIIPGNKYKYVEDWGEELNGYSKTVLVVFDVEEQEMKLVSYDGGEDRCITCIVPDSKDPNAIYCILHYIRPFRVSLYGMLQRRSDLVKIDNWQGSRPKITPIINGDDGIAVLDVTVSPNGGKLVWLQAPSGGPHNKAFEMWSCLTNDFEGTKSKIISDMPKQLFFRFQRVFLHKCWYDDDTVMFHSITKCRSLVRSVDLKDGSIDLVNIPNNDSLNSSYYLLDMNNGDLLVAETSLSMAPAFIFAKNLGGGIFSFKRLTPFSSSSNHLSSQIDWQLVPATFENHDLEHIFAVPKVTESGRKVPLIIIPHGGPHNLMLSEFSYLYSGFVLCGYGILLINYPGSLGFDSCDQLPGKIGTLDLQSCQQAAVETLAKFTDKLDKDNVFIFGGSHGGFLSLRLVAEFPDFYKACITRNPVCDFVQMVGVTDMPDWVFVECGLQPSLTGFINLHDITKPEVLAKFNEQSPTRFADKINCPILMLLGSKDRVVPISQGLVLYRMLRQLKPKLPIEVLQYDCNHSLESINVHADAFVNTIRFFDKYRK